MIEFFVPCVFPTTTAQMKRFSAKTGHYFHSKEQKAAINTIAAILAPYRPAEPIRGAVSLEVTITWPWLGKHSKKIRALESIPHTSKPDADNVIKTLQDELVTWRFIESDQCVSRLVVEKWWGDAPGINVIIDSITSDLTP